MYAMEVRNVRNVYVRNRKKLSYKTITFWLSNLPHAADKRR